MKLFIYYVKWLIRTWQRITLTYCYNRPEPRSFLHISFAVFVSWSTKDGVKNDYLGLVSRRIIFQANNHFYFASTSSYIFLINVEL